MEKPVFDQALADSYIGKYILIGLSYLDEKGELLHRQQMHGIIASATPAGIAVELKGTRNGSQWNMPPALDAIRPAAPGHYMLKETNETVFNPDLTLTWEIHKPKEA